jgi:primosomal protein N''
MTFNVEEIAQTMIGAAREAVSDRWPQVQALAEVEFRNLAGSLEAVGRLVAEGKIDQARAQHHAHIYQITARSILATAEGLGVLTAEQALNAGVLAVTKVVNTAVKFALL